MAQQLYVTSVSYSVKWEDPGTYTIRSSVKIKLSSYTWHRVLISVVVGVVVTSEETGSEQRSDFPTKQQQMRPKLKTLNLNMARSAGLRMGP